MPNGREHLKYENFGKHKYSGRDTSDCDHGCGCWVGPARSGSLHAGVDPFGRCPLNVLREIPEAFGSPLNEKEILEDFINSRIASLEKDLSGAIKWKKIAMKARGGTKIDLQTNVDLLLERTETLETRILRMKEHLTKVMKE